MNNDNYFEIPTTYLEETTPEFSFQLVNSKLENILSGNLDKLTLTVYAPDVKGKPIIGKNDHVNILNANQGTVTSGGKVTLILKKKDTVLSVPNQINKYIALIEYTFNSNTEEGKVEVAYFIRPGYKVK